VTVLCQRAIRGEPVTKPHRTYDRMIKRHCASSLTLNALSKSPPDAC
jgi:hypothetical protein